MGRVDSTEVKEIIATDLTDLSAYITAANILVTSELTASGLSNAHLKEIERWLAAHFVSIKDPIVSKEKIGDAEVTYASGGMTYTNAMKDAAGLNSSPYGQQALILDTTGILRGLGTKKATFSVMKKDE